jgi:hypothetical protein
MDIGFLYHWSPRSRYKNINRRGLRLDHSAGPTTSSSICVSDARPVLCFGTSAIEAWSLSAELTYTPAGWWDLWSIHVKDTDEVLALPTWGNRLSEIRLFNPVPRSRLWYVGSRESKRGAKIKSDEET